MNFLISLIGILVGILGAYVGYSSKQKYDLKQKNADAVETAKKASETISALKVINNVNRTNKERVDEIMRLREETNDEEVINRLNDITRDALGRMQDGRADNRM